MEKITLLVLALVLMIATTATAQDLDDQRGGFKKENLFTGGSISMGFTGYSFQIGANPMFGYSVAPWIDAGVVGNINYASFRDVYIVNVNDKVRETTYGAGAFTRIYPLRFLFAQAQFEHNFISEKFIPGNGATVQKNKVEANSLLVGAGYTTDRYPGSGRPFFYLSVLFDVLDGEFSPYTRPGGGILPIFRAGVQVPLFQNSRNRF
jgi:hypothetical protein